MKSYKDKVYSIALYHFHGDVAIAADVTQQVFVKAITSIGQFRGDSEIGTVCRTRTSDGERVCGFAKAKSRGS